MAAGIWGNFLRIVVSALYRALKWLIPKNRFGDWLLGYLLFVHSHKRLPSRQMLFNDVFFKIKTSAELLDPLRVFVTDKEYLKLYVKAVVGAQYNVPTIAVIRDKVAVKHYPFPPDCVIKPTHLSGAIIIRKNNAPVDVDKIASWFDTNYYEITREINYKFLRPKVIIEPLIFGDDNVDLYSFFCLKGVPKLIQLSVNCLTARKNTFFDMAWHKLDFTMLAPIIMDPINKPDNHLEMLMIANKLSAGFSFVRIDMYSDGKSCLIGEITHCDGSANATFNPKSGENVASRIIFD